MSQLRDQPPSLSELDLSENKVGVKGTEALSTVLQENPILVSLKLSGNELNDRAAKYLADALVTNQKVEHLDLSHNRLGEPAGKCHRNIVFGCRVGSSVAPVGKTHTYTCNLPIHGPLVSRAPHTFMRNMNC